MEKKKVKSLINILSILLCTGIVVGILLKNDFVGVFATIKDAKWIFLLIAIFSQVLMPLIDGCIIMILSRRYRKDYTYKEGVTNELIGLLFCFITPSATGGQFAQVTVFNKQKIEPQKSASLLLIKFLAYQIISVALGIFTLIINKEYMVSTFNILTIGNFTIKYTTLAYIGLAINFIAGFGLFFLAYSKLVNGLVKGIYKLLNKLHIVKDIDTALKRIDDKISSFKNNLQDIKNMPGKFILILLLNVFKFSLSFIIPFLVARSLGIMLQANQIIIMMSLACYLNLITTFIPIPGSSGGAELFFNLLFLPILGSETLTTSTMLLWRTITFYIPLIYTSIVTLSYNKQSKLKNVDYVPNKYMWFYYHNFKQELSLMNDVDNNYEEDADEGYY